MRLWPAIDVSGGRCVRLEQGRFDRVTVYADDPLAVAAQFQAQGADALHVVDLDGARDPSARQVGIVQAVARCTPLSVQVGGGIRTVDDIARLLDAGAARVVVGSVAVREPELAVRMIQAFGSDRVVFALDVRLDARGEPLLATQGWRATEGATLWDALERFLPAGLRTVLCTDIGRDGMLAGPALGLYEQILRRAPGLELLASGGIASLDDLRALRALGAGGAVVGKALYERRFTLAEALAC